MAKVYLRICVECGKRFKTIQDQEVHQIQTSHIIHVYTIRQYFNLTLIEASMEYNNGIYYSFDPVPVNIMPMV